MSYRLGFLGLGVMGGTILERFLDSGKLSPSKITAFDSLPDKCIAFGDKGVHIADSANDIFSADVAVIAVKPQNYREILQNSDIKCKTLLSIMAGVRISTLKALLPETTGVCRVMPNTPATVGKGASAVAYSGVSDEDKALISAILSSLGEYIEVSEDKFDAVTSVSGSGPAYVYMFAAALVKAGVEGGLTPEESRLLALQTIEGGAAYAKVAPYDLETLTERVCSKGGTTIEAVEVFKKSGLDEIVSEAVKACRVRSRELSEKL